MVEGVGIQNSHNISTSPNFLHRAKVQNFLSRKKKNRHRHPKKKSFNQKSKNIAACHKVGEYFLPPESLRIVAEA